MFVKDTRFTSNMASISNKFMFFFLMICSLFPSVQDFLPRWVDQPDAFISICWVESVVYRLTQVWDISYITRCQIRPYGLAIWFLIFSLLVFNYSAFRIWPNGSTSTGPLQDPFAVLHFENRLYIDGSRAVVV